MHYFKWSGVLAIRTMQCIPMLFLYYTLHLYYTGVALLARLLILLPYVDPVCRRRWLLSSSLLTSSSSCTAATLTDWIVFFFLLHATPASCFILFLNSISNLCPSLDSRPDAPLHVADCIAPFPHSSKASSSVLDLCTLPCLVRHCLGLCSHLVSYILTRFAWWQQDLHAIKLLRAHIGEWTITWMLDYWWVMCFTGYRLNWNPWIWIPFPV